MKKTKIEHHLQLYALFYLGISIVFIGLVFLYLLWHL